MSEQRQLLELIDRLGNLLRAEARLQGKTDGLQPVHIQSLDYLARCNRLSDTPLALSQYLGISKGTTSQSIMVLCNKGLVDKVPDDRDRRVVHLQLTDAGRAQIDALTTRIDALELDTVIPEKQQQQISTALSELLRRLIRDRGGKSFGVCKTCRHFVRGEDGIRCGLINEPLEMEQTFRICHEHEYPATGTDGG